MITQVLKTCSMCCLCFFGIIARSFIFCPMRCTVTLCQPSHHLQWLTTSEICHIQPVNHCAASAKRLHWARCLHVAQRSSLVFALYIFSSDPCDTYAGYPYVTALLYRMILKSSYHSHGWMWSSHQSSLASRQISSPLCISRLPTTIRLDVGVGDLELTLLVVIRLTLEERGRTSDRTSFISSLTSPPAATVGVTPIDSATLAASIMSAIVSTLCCTTNAFMCGCRPRRMTHFNLPSSNPGKCLGVSWRSVWRRSCFRHCHQCFSNNSMFWTFYPRSIILSRCLLLSLCRNRLLPVSIYRV